MFRLMKLAAYALFGYAIYEFVRGLVDMPPGPGRMRIAETPGASGSRARLTGGGTGNYIATQDPDGASVPHRVGRGVV